VTFFIHPPLCPACARALSRKHNAKSGQKEKRPTGGFERVACVALVFHPPLFLVGVDRERMGERARALPTTLTHTRALLIRCQREETRPFNYFSNGIVFAKARRFNAYSVLNSFPALLHLKQFTVIIESDTEMRILKGKELCLCCFSKMRLAFRSK
jgi:hypothetical protein